MMEHAEWEASLITMDSHSDNFTTKKKNVVEITTFFVKATSGFEPLHTAFAEPCLTTWLRRRKAGDGIRTRDIFLGKEVLYH